MGVLITFLFLEISVFLRFINKQDVLADIMTPIS